MDNNVHDLDNRLTQLEDAIFYIRDTIRSTNQETARRNTRNNNREENETNQEEMNKVNEKKEDKNDSKYDLDNDVNESNNIKQANKEPEQLGEVDNAENNGNAKNLVVICKVENDTVNRLIEQISRLEIAITNHLNHSLVAAQATKLNNGGYYRNWDERHQNLLAAEYVPKAVLCDVLTRSETVIPLKHLGWKIFKNLLESMPRSRVSRTDRFPKYGKYVNLNDGDLYKNIQYLMEYCYMYSAEGNAVHASNSTLDSDDLRKILYEVQKIVMKSDKASEWAGMTYDRESYETHFALEWVKE